MKKIMGVLLALAMLVGLMPVMAVNAAWDGTVAPSSSVRISMTFLS